MKIHQYFVYILTNPGKTSFYTGFTNSLKTRISQHVEKADARDMSTYCGRYNCRHLVYFEKYQWAQEGITREKEVKKFSRKRKLALIRTMNPNVDFLEDQL